MTDDNYDTLIRDTFREVETLAQLPNDFLMRLYHHPDDWAFIIQTHALIEGALSDFVTLALGDERLLPVIERLSVGDSRFGKLAFARALEVLSDEHIAFVRTISQLRNQLVHRFRNHIGFSLESYVANLSNDAREQMFRGCLCFPANAHMLEIFRKHFRLEPKIIVLLGFMHFIGQTVGLSKKKSSESATQE